jgi:hypothetical protein
MLDIAGRPRLSPRPARPYTYAPARSGILQGTWGFWGLCVGSVSAYAQDIGSNSFGHSVRANAAARAIAERQCRQRASKSRRPSSSQRSIG